MSSSKRRLLSFVLAVVLLDAAGAKAQICEPTADGFACVFVACSPIPEDQCIATVLHLDVSSGAITAVVCECMDFNDCHVEFGDATPRAVGNCPPGQICQVLGEDTDSDGIEDQFRAECAPAPVGVCCLDITDGPISYETCADVDQNSCDAGGGIFHEATPACAEIEACCLTFGGSFCTEMNPFCCFDSGGFLKGNECCPYSSAPQLQRQFDEHGDSTGAPESKNRVLPIKAGDPGALPQTIRVTWIEQPNWPGGHEALEGQQKFITEPFRVCEHAADGLGVRPPSCGPAPRQPQKWFWVAFLTCDANEAWYGDLTDLVNYCRGSGEPCSADADCAAGTCGVDGVIHIADPGIVPTKNTNQQAVYLVQVITEGCPPFGPSSYFGFLFIVQDRFGDLGEGSGGDCPVPPSDGSVSLIPDVTARLSKFSNLVCAPKKARCEIAFAAIDFKCDIIDILVALDGFSGIDYTYSAGPVCPPTAEVRECSEARPR